MGLRKGVAQKSSAAKALRGGRSFAKGGRSAGSAPLRSVAAGARRVVSDNSQAFSPYSKQSR